MSIEAIHFVMKTEIPDGIAKLVAFVIADYAHAETGRAWPKVETLARKCSQSVRTVQRKIRVLEDLGILRVERRHADSGRQRENLFVLHLPGVPRPAANDPGDKRPAAGNQRGEGDTQSPTGPGSSVTPGGDTPDTPGGDTAVTPLKESVIGTVRRGTPQPPVTGGPADGPNPISGKDPPAAEADRFGLAHDPETDRDQRGAEFLRKRVLGVGKILDEHAPEAAREIDRLDCLAGLRTGSLGALEGIDGAVERLTLTVPCRSGTLRSDFRIGKLIHSSCPVRLVRGCRPLMSAIGRSDQR